MKVGVSLLANNSDDLKRFADLEEGKIPPTGDGPDNLTFEEELRFGELVEPLGFDSIWTVEHHFTPYTMIADPLQWLTYWAGRTERIGLGTGVVVLPWHNPVRVAEQISMLQHMAGEGREIMIGFGRGIARREYGGMNVDQTVSRELFDESVRIVRGLIENERFAYQGKHFKVPDVSQRPESPDLSMRPRPRDSRSLVDNFRVAWGSPESVRYTAKLGLKPMVVPQRGLQDYIGELQEFNRLRGEAGGAPANPILHLHVICTETEEKAREYMRYEYGLARSSIVNYEFGGVDFRKIGGYDYYADLGEQMRAAQGAEDDHGLLESRDGILADRLGYGSDAPIGTPDQVLAAIQRTFDWLHPEQICCVFKMGSMPYDIAEKSLRLFAKEVLPAVHELQPLEPLVSSEPVEFTRTVVAAQ